MAILLPNAKQYFADQNGNPLVGGKVFFYVPNTLTPKDTYKDSAKTLLNTNPVILDSNGTAVIYGDGLYRVILKDSSDVQIYDLVTAGSATSAMIAAGTDDSAPVTSKGLADAGIDSKPFATQSEAEQGLLDDVVMSPLTTRQAVTKTTTEGGYMGDLAVKDKISLDDVNELENTSSLIGSTSDSKDAAELTPSVGISVIGSSVFAQSIGRRQTVALGPVSTTGFPIFWASAYADRNLEFFNLSEDNPLVIVAANGTKTRIGLLTSNETIESIPASTTSFIYADVDEDGTVTLGTLSPTPAYIASGTPSSTFNQFTYDYMKKKAYMGDGTTYEEVYRVIIGEVTTSSSAITSAICYAYNGRAITPQTAVGGYRQLTHNIGCVPLQADFWLVNITGDLNYTTGMWTKASYNPADIGMPIGTIESRTTVSVATGGSAIIVSNRTSGGYNTIINGSWNWIAVVDRGWD